ncbi:MAG: T9SS type A sorting domain-containing protein, partial [Cyclobacteriaceae bacterium]|nr:T9SS type A sorting domain-containing protein [Cyclobacteriaceae bacterium HetDA_MAG_MS6]
RVLATDGGSDSFWVSVDGTNTIRLVANTASGGPNLDRINVTVSSAPSGVSAAFIEAESGTLESPMQAFGDVNASNGQYVGVTGVSSTGSVPATGKTSLSVDLEAGTYKIFGRVLATDGGSDSFWVSVDGGTAYKWNSIQLSTTYIWDEVHDADNSNTVVTWTLSAGSHTIDFYYRESNTRLDRVYITKNGDTPESAGGRLAMDDAIKSNIQDVVKLYPNPAQEKMILDLGHLKQAQVMVFDLQGKIITTKVYQDSPMDLELPRGIYVLKAIHPEKTFSRKLIFQ